MEVAALAPAAQTGRTTKKVFMGIFFNVRCDVLLLCSTQKKKKKSEKLSRRLEDVVHLALFEVVRL